MHKSTGQRDRSDATVGSRFETRYKQTNWNNKQTQNSLRLDRESNHRLSKDKNALWFPKPTVVSFRLFRQLGLEHALRSLREFAHFCLAYFREGGTSESVCQCGGAEPDGIKVSVKYLGFSVSCSLLFYIAIYTGVDVGIRALLRLLRRRVGWFRRRR